MRLRILSLAEADLLDGFRFYERQTAGIGWYFLESLRLCAGVHRRVFAFHRLLSKRFPYAVYYDLAPDEIRVWRVLDCRRNPRWITTQLKKDRGVHNA